MDFLLTIGIPTSGRIATLNNNLKYLKKIIIESNIQNKVEILISDNAKFKNNLSIDYAKKNNFINYYHSENQGLDFNIYNLIKLSKGKYIWFCQDHTRINLESLLSILKKLNNKNLDYIFASTKHNLSLDNVIKNDNRFIGFRAIYLNTNIVKKEKILLEYNKLFDYFNGSNVLFQHSIIHILLKLKNSKDENLLILLNKNSDYKYFETNDEHVKFTWSQDLMTYLNILIFSGKMYDEIKTKFKINNNIIKELFRKNDYSVQTIYKISKLRSKYENFSIEKKYLNKVLFHPTFSIVDRFILKYLLLNNKFFFTLSSILFITEMYFFFTLPKIFFKKLISKIL